jgi:hypothetical protein
LSITAIRSFRSQTFELFYSFSFVVSVADPYHFDADPDLACHFGADPDLTFHFNRGPDPSFQIKAEILKKCSNRLPCCLQIDPDPAYHFHADPYPADHFHADPLFQFDADLAPQRWLL